MHETENEGVELASYQFKDVVNVWQNLLEEGQGANAEPIEQSESENVFLDNFLQQLFPIKLHDKEPIEVLKFHQSLATKALLMSKKDLKPSPSSYIGRHISFHADQCLLFFLTKSFPKKQLTNIWCIDLMTLFGGLIADNRCIGIDCRACFISRIFPSKDRNLFCYESIFLISF